MVTGPLASPSAARCAVMNAFIAPLFQLLCCVPQSCATALVGSPVSGGGAVVGGLAVLRRRVVEQGERLHVPAGVHPGAGLVAELVEHRVADPADGLLQYIRVGEPAHPGQRAEVVVE